jgi:hypothetical protein
MVHPNRIRAIAAVVLIAACMAIVGHRIWIDLRRAETGANRTQVEANLPSLTLEQISSLNPKAFERSLPQLQQAAAQPGLKTVVSRETLAAIAGKLRQTGESTPDYWPATLRFIQFASSQMAPDAPPPGQPPRILSEILSRGLMRGIREKGITINFDAGYLGNGEFTNCRIIFTPNPVQLANATFRKCAFEIPITDSPSPYIKKVGRVLLDSDLGSVSIPSL